MRQSSNFLPKELQQVLRARRRTEPVSTSFWASFTGCVMLALATSACLVEHRQPPATMVSVPKVPPHLLARAPEPKCTYTDEEPAIASSEPNAGSKALEESIQRRERERDCFRDAEYRVRAKLAELQASVRATIVAEGPSRK